MDLWVEVIVLILFLLLGILFSMGKGVSLIAGFHTMPKQKQEKYDKVRLCKFMGKVMFALCLPFVMWILAEQFHVRGLYYIGVAVFLGTIVFTLIYTNTFHRFEK